MDSEGYRQIIKLTKHSKWPLSNKRNGSSIELLGSDAVVRESYTLMSQLEEINIRMIEVHNARKQIKQIDDLLDVLETKLNESGLFDPSQK